MRLTPLLGALAVLLAACAGGSDAASCDPLAGVRSGLCPAPVAERGPAPDQVVPVLGADGQELSIDRFAGEVVVVNFWASWCGPCRTEQPELNAAAARLPDGEVAFLGVNVQDSEVNALRHAEEFDIPYPSVFDPSSAYAADWGGLGPSALPSTIIVDARGRVAVRIFGATTEQEVVSLVTAVAEGGRA